MLILASLQGSKSQLNLHKAQRYVKSLENADYGFARSFGAASSVSAVFDAVSSFKLLGVPVSQPGNVINYLQTMLDSSSGLFLQLSADVPSVRATAQALQALEMLGALETRSQHRSWIEPALERLRDYLASHVSPTGGAFVFGDDASVTPAEQNYYGLVIARAAGYDYTAVHGGAGSWVAEAQKLLATVDGSGDDDVSSGPALHAALALRLLQDAHDIPAGSVFPHAQALATRLMNARVYSVIDLANAEVAVALSPAFADLMSLSVHYEQLGFGDASAARLHLVSGAQMRPEVRVVTRDGHPHVGMEVETDVRYGGKQLASARMHADASRGVYSPADLISTTDVLGAITATTVARLFLPSVGVLSLTHTDSLMCGYSIRIDSDARLDLSGRSYAPGDVVPHGTEFSFTVHLGTGVESEMKSGDFELRMSVLDSSGVVLSRSMIDARSHSGDLNFEYALRESQVLPGALLFRFEVSPAGGVPHTQGDVSYLHAAPMVASSVSSSISAANAARRLRLSLSESFKMTMVPGTLQDLRTIAPLASEAHAAKRHFAMNLQTVDGDVVLSVRGRPAAGGAYEFSAELEPYMDLLGDFDVVFLYLPLSGEPIELAQFDATTQEVLDDASHWTAEVASKLQMADVIEQPSGDEFTYGSTVAFRFKVKDAISGRYVRAGRVRSDATVYLSVAQSGSNSGAAAARVPSEQLLNTDEFEIRWMINPNALSGRGELQLLAQDAAGRSKPLLVPGSLTSEMTLPVTIGGKLDLNATVRSAAKLNHERSALVAEFVLRCGDSTLFGADLVAFLSRAEGSRRVPVAGPLSVLSDESGLYSTSYSAAHDTLPSGSYRFSFVREVDADREDAVPLFVVDLDHVAPAAIVLPLRFDTIAAVCLLCAVVLFLYYQASRYTRVSAKNSKKNK